MPASVNGRALRRAIRPSTEDCQPRRNEVIDAVKIAILDDYQNAARGLECFARLAGHDVIAINRHVRDPADLAQCLDGVEAVVMIQQRCPLPRAAIERLPASVRMLSQTGRNVSHIDVAACTGRGIIVAAGGTSNSHPPAELTWALILASLRNLPLEAAAMKSGRWQSTLGVQVYGRTLGIYAYGRIGSVVAQVGRAFGMRVICFGRAGSTARAREAGFEIAESRDAFFATADVVSLHLPLNKETRGIVKASDLALMKPTALLVNTSRAGLVGDAVLAAALRNGRPGRAAVDVFDDEPVPATGNPLVGLDTCLCTPHLGYVEQDTYERYLGNAFDQVVAYAAGKPINVVNPEVLTSR
jgi:D-3-phosphoglycerate dehydrogenase